MRLGRCTICGNVKILAMHGQFKGSDLRAMMQKSLDETAGQQLLKRNLNKIPDVVPWGVCAKDSLDASASEAAQYEFGMRLMKAILLPLALGAA
jgi:hypothetical protein